MPAEELVDVVGLVEAVAVDVVAHVVAECLSILTPQHCLVHGSFWAYQRG